MKTLPWTFGLALAGALGAVSLLALSPQPALAFDEGRGSTVDTLFEMFGLAEKKEDPVINYRQRAPLVLPPRTALPQPRPAIAGAAPNWPQDQEVVEARRLAAADKLARSRDESAPRGLVANPPNHPPGPAGLAGPQTACRMSTDQSEVGNCSPEVFWKSLEVKSEEKYDLKAGVEPDRKYLTQPPKGYLKATRTVKATFEAPQPKEDGQAADYYRQKPKPQE